jgi:hypothetical protein
MSNSLAIVYTVKDEARFLEPAISFYLAHNVSKVYIFSRSVDPVLERLYSDHHLVCLRQSLEGLHDFGPHPKWVSDCLSSSRTAEFDIHKRVNTWIASILCRHEGIEWLASIDPDELIVSSPVSLDITSLLVGLDNHIDQLLLSPAEVLPIRSALDNPFIGSALFFRYTAIELLLFRLLGRLLLRRAYDGRIFYYMQYLTLKIFGCHYLPSFRDPHTNKIWFRTLLLGYTSYKSVVRVNATDDMLFDIHCWRSHCKRVVSMKMGLVLHFDLPTYEDFTAKFAKRSIADTQKLRMFGMRNLLAKMACFPQQSVSQAFYNNFVAIDFDSKLSNDHVVRTDLIIQFFLQISQMADETMWKKVFYKADE